jgi:hypothetical protein
MAFRPFEKIGDIRLYVRHDDVKNTYEGYALDSHFKEILRTNPFPTREIAVSELRKLVSQKISAKTLTEHE